MVDIIIPSKKIGCKDCFSWVPLRDGTLTGDPKYCQLSLECKQIGMRGDYHTFTKSLLVSMGYNDEQIEKMYPYNLYLDGVYFDYFCTGMYVSKNEIDDQEVS
jgi:hypothetical protein